MANETLAQVAITGVESGSWAPLENSWCQRFARLCLEHAYGNKYDSFMRATANATGRAFASAGLIAPAGNLQAGDLLYKCPSEGYGHVGIYVGDDRVAENSSTSIGRVRGALGFRTLSQFGVFSYTIRLPVPVEPQGYTLRQSNGATMAQLKLISGHNYVKAADYAAWFKLKVAWQAPKVLLNGIECSAQLVGDGSDRRAYIPFTEAAQTNGITYVVDNAKREIRLSPVV